MRVLRVPCSSWETAAAVLTRRHVSGHDAAMRSLSRSLMFLFVFAWLLYVVDLLNGYVIDRHLLETQYFYFYF